jgi:hypothetical protein
MACFEVRCGLTDAQVLARMDAGIECASAEEYLVRVRLQSEGLSTALDLDDEVAPVSLARKRQRDTEHCLDDDAALVAFRSLRAELEALSAKWLDPEEGARLGKDMLVTSSLAMRGGEYSTRSLSHTEEHGRLLSLCEGGPLPAPVELEEYAAWLEEHHEAGLECLDAPGRLLPPLRLWSHWRALMCEWAKPPEGFEGGCWRPPSLGLLLRLDDVATTRLLEKLVALATSRFRFLARSSDFPNPLEVLTERVCLWVWALLARLEKPLLVETQASLSDFVKLCGQTINGEGLYPPHVSPIVAVCVNDFGQAIPNH